MDLAGHGASGANRVDWTMGNFGEDVAAVVRQIQNPKIILVGHSMGAPVALEATRRIGDRVIGIVAVDSLKTIGQPVMPEAQIEKVLQPFKDDFIGHTREFVTTELFTLRRRSEVRAEGGIRHVVVTAAGGCAGDELAASPGLHATARGAACACGGDQFEPRRAGG